MFRNSFRIRMGILIASPDLKISFDLRGEKITTGNKIQDSRTWKSGSNAMFCLGSQDLFFLNFFMYTTYVHLPTVSIFIFKNTLPDGAHRLDC